MYEPLKVVSWASAKADCPIRYTLSSHDDMTFIFGRGRDEFEFSFDVGALRQLLKLGAEVLAAMDSAARLEDADDMADGELVAAGERSA